MKKQQRLFDLDEYKNKAKQALQKLEKTQKPGEHTGKVGKSEILKSVKEEITSLMKKGYTAKQIADAFKDDVFGILPKTITEIAGEKTKKKTTRTTRNQQQLNDNTNKKDIRESSSNDNGSFNVKPDTDEF